MNEKTINNVFHAFRTHHCHEWDTDEASKVGLRISGISWSGVEQSGVGSYLQASQGCSGILQCEDD